MMRLAIVATLLVGVGVCQAEDKKVPDVLNFKMKSLTGDEVDLSKYQGKVLLIVNTASECGATPQYEALQKLHEKYSKDGLVVLGFPCNQFGRQEPGSAKEISEFCSQTYGITFDLFEKIEVNGDGQAPLYKYLTSKETNTDSPGAVRWNFEKFLIGRDGRIIARFRTPVQPESAEVVEAIKKELAAK